VSIFETELQRRVEEKYEEMGAIRIRRR